MSAISPPFNLPGYRFIRRVGRGGMANVYLALQESLKRPVAIKILGNQHAPGESLIARFEHEARTIARLDHPNIVSIYDVGRDHTGQLYYTMPFMPSGDLRQQQIGNDETRIIEVVRALASALGHAHEQGIVHRDVKPENVLFDALKRPLLADFGIAYSTSNSADRLTREGSTLGSSGYMSPEQARGFPLDGRSDLYSLGVLCFELLTGDQPFRGPDTLAVALAHLNEPVRRLPPEQRRWQPIIDKLLAKNPDARYQNAGELIAALDQLEQRAAPGMTALWTWPLAGELLRPASARLWTMLGATALGLLLLVAAGLLWLQPKSTGPDGLHGDTTLAVAPTGQASAAAPALNAPTPLDHPASAAILANAAPAVPAMPAHAGDNDNSAQPRKTVRAVLLQTGWISTDSIRLLQHTWMPAERFLDQYPIAGLDSPLITRASDLIDLPDPTEAAQWSSPATASTAVARPRAARKPAPVVEEKRPMQAGDHLRDPGGPELVFVPDELAVGAGRDRIAAPFAMAVADVTRGEYEEFARTTGRTESDCREPKSLLSRLRSLNWRNPGFVQDASHPVLCVSWRDAQAYARWLSQRTGQNYRLPTQQEWLHVARQLPASANCRTSNIGDRSKGGIGGHFDCSDGFPRTAPVGSFPASPLGLYDLAGNVSTWMGDCSNADCGEVWFRGLSWRDGPGESNTEHRGESSPDVGYTTIGLRVVRSIRDGSGGSVAAISAKAK